VTCFVRGGKGRNEINNGKTQERIIETFSKNIYTSIIYTKLQRKYGVDKERLLTEYKLIYAQLLCQYKFYCQRDIFVYHLKTVGTIYYIHMIKENNIGFE
jgi:hypothetical protein